MVNQNTETEGWSSIRLMPALLRIFTRVNLLIFLGEEEASSPETFDEVMQFLWTCALAFPILILTPVFLMP